MDETRQSTWGSGQFAGSAVVVGASYGPGSTLLRLQAFVGKSIEYTLGDVPDSAGAAEFRKNYPRPIAIRIQDGGKQCTVIVLTQNGPRHLKVALGTALALHKSGLHAVVYGGLQVATPCSTQS